MTRYNELERDLRQKAARLWQFALLSLVFCAFLASIAYGLRHEYLTEDTVFQTNTHATVPAELGVAIIDASLEGYLDRGTDQDWDLVDSGQDWYYLILTTLFFLASLVGWLSWQRSWQAFLCTIGLLLTLFLTVNLDNIPIISGQMKRNSEVPWLITFGQLQDANAPDEVLETPYDTPGNAGDICLRKNGTRAFLTVRLPSGRCALQLNTSQLPSILADQGHLVLAQHAHIAKRNDLVLQHLQAMRGGWAFQDSHNFWRLRMMVLAMERLGHSETIPPAIVAMAKPVKMEADNLLGRYLYILSGVFLFSSVALSLLAVRRTLTWWQLRA